MNKEQSTPAPWKHERFERNGLYGFRATAHTVIGVAVVAEAYPSAHLVAINEANMRLIAATIYFTNHATCRSMAGGPRPSFMVTSAAHGHHAHDCPV